MWLKYSVKSFNFFQQKAVGRKSLFPHNHDVVQMHHIFEVKLNFIKSDKRTDIFCSKTNLKNTVSSYSSTNYGKRIPWVKNHNKQHFFFRIVGRFEKTG